MKNNKKFLNINVGNMVARHTHEEISVQVPPKVTGDVKDEEESPKGFAKASPNFQKLEPEKELTEEEKQKAIANNKKLIKPNDNNRRN